MALSVLGMMDAKTVSPGLITYNAALASCKKGGNWEVALQLWQSLHASWHVELTGRLIISTCAS